MDSASTSVDVRVVKDAPYRAKVKYMQIVDGVITGSVCYVNPGETRSFCVDASRTVFVSHEAMQ